MSQWQLTTVVSSTMQTPTARTLSLALSQPFRALPGQHIDIRLTAEDGYSTARTYSLSDVREPGIAEITVEALADGEVSPYLVDVVEPGDPLEIFGPNGGWFTWDAADPHPVQLIAGGSGVAPLMSMIRTREVLAPATPFRLLYSVRSPERVYFRDEFALLTDHRRLPVDIMFTRPGGGSDRAAARLVAEEVSAATIPAADDPTVFICGTNQFVEFCAAAMIGAGHDPGRIRTERFGESAPIR
ncbi:ferredoxin reductase [Gordonia jinhuaensis]|uniref:Oxidoreductase n=1 Tax=Gordonia jinhuaensis TaxID=1517702 RepID=A0A916TCA1_9ACTN|nr:FAD-binding oxidoreductase [Gordonia jinhuaensis]GGB38999.1 oxidoreductase [Gordonia jinhuaensis]